MFSHRDYVRACLNEFVKKHNSEINKVIELGGGITNFREYFNLFDKSWCGVDLMQLAEKNSFACDYHSTPFPDKEFDLVFCCHADLFVKPP